MTKFKFGDKVFCKGLFGNGIYFKPSYHGSDEPMCYVLFENYGLKVARLSSIKKVSDWIQCSERMPGNGDVLWCYNGTLVVGWHNKYIGCDEILVSGGGYLLIDNIDDAMWMPLPAPPTEVEQ